MYIVRVWDSPPMPPVPLDSRWTSVKIFRQPIVTRTATSVIMVRTPGTRSEEHTSELQSRGHLVCRLLLEKKKKSRTRMDSIVISHPESENTHDTKPTPAHKKE